MQKTARLSLLPLVIILGVVVVLALLCHSTYVVETSGIKASYESIEMDAYLADANAVHIRVSFTPLQDRQARLYLDAYIHEASKTEAARWDSIHLSDFLYSLSDRLDIGVHNRGSNLLGLIVFRINPK